MARRSPTYQIIINAVTFILLEVAALCMVNNNGVLQRIWLSRLGHNVSYALWGSGEDIKYYFSLKKTNQKLSEEKESLMEELEKYKALYNADCEVKKDSLIEKVSTYEYLPASIIKLSSNKQHNYFLINKGEDDGVGIDNGVITNDGIIGIISAVGKKHSYGLSLMNSEIKISSRIGREGAIGWISWDGVSSSKAILHDIPCNAEFNLEDTVYTSGFSQIFPPDIPLGKIENFRLYKGSVYEMEIDLFEDYSCARYVSVVKNLDAEDIEQLEENEQ